MTGAEQRDPSDDVTEKPFSALHGSIQRKKDMSYYYAHAPRDTGEAAAALPVHRPIATTAYHPDGAPNVPIKRFQFLDEGPWAKVYLPFDNLSTITSDDVVATFEVNSFQVLVRGLQRATLEFRVAKTYGEIVPEESFAKLMKAKILIKLRKMPKPLRDRLDDAIDNGAESTPPDLADEGVDIDADAVAPEESAPALPPPGAPAEAVSAAAAALEETSVADPVNLSAEAAAASSPTADGEDHDADDIAADDRGSKAALNSSPDSPKGEFTHWYKLRAE